MTNPYAPPQAVVADVLDPVAGMVLAGRGTRLGASILDGLIFFVMVYLPGFLGAIAGGALEPSTLEKNGTAAFGLGIGLALAGFVAWLWFTIKFLKANGQSIGKKACSIKLVRRDGSAVSLSRVIWLRNVLNNVFGFFPLYGLIDALFIFGEARRCVHDHIADTIVIKA